MSPAARRSKPASARKAAPARRKSEPAAPRKATKTTTKTTTKAKTKARGAAKAAPAGAGAARTKASSRDGATAAKRSRAKKAAPKRRRRGTLVVGYDRTETSRGAVLWAAQRLAPDDKLVLVHAGRPLHAPASPLSSPAERRRFAHALVDELLLEYDLGDVQVRVELADGGPVDALIDAARRHRAEAIVVGSEGHSRLRRALGTVTTELLRRSPVAVTAVPAAAAPASA